MIRRARGGSGHPGHAGLAGVLAIMLVGSAQAAERPPEGRDGRPPEPPGIFISPAGKAYRAAPGEPYPSVNWFAAADVDRDGVLTPAEFEADATSFFAELDVDRDGRLGPREIERYENEITPEVSMAAASPRFGPRGGMPGPFGPGGGPPPPGMPGGPGPGGGPPKGVRYGEMPMGAGVFGLLNIPEPVAGADLDISGSVTLDEFRRTARHRFALLDRDADRRLPLSELPETPAQAFGGRRGKRPRPPRR